MSIYEFTSDSQTTIFKFLKYNSGISTRLLRKFKTIGAFTLNGVPTSIMSEIQPSDVITVNIEETSGDNLPEDIPIDIIFEDKFILAVNKPPNMILHPTCSRPTGTLVNAVAFHFASQKIDIPIRPVIRLDKDTSGIVIFAKNAFIQEAIIQQMKSKAVKKTYIAVVEGVPNPESGRIDAPISRLPGSIITRQVSEDGESAITNYKVIKSFDGYSLLEVQPETGRTHQIRVHMQHIGNPILSDTLYGTKSELINRQALHAYSYSFTHPMNKKSISLTCPLPQDINKLIQHM